LIVANCFLPCVWFVLFLRIIRLTGISGKELAASGISVYGPRTTVTLAVDGVEGAHEFLLIDDFTARHGQWVKTNTFTSVG